MVSSSISGGTIAAGAAVGGPIGATVAAGIGVVGTIAGALGLGASDPAKDAIRIDNLNFAAGRASVGDTSPYARLGGRNGWDYVNTIAHDKAASGSAVAMAHAKVLLLQLQGQGVAGDLGTALIGVSNIPGTVVETVKRNIPIVLIGLVVVIGLVAFVRKGS